MKDAVTNKIRLLKNIKPSPDWLKSQRSNLLFEISQSGKQAKSVWRMPVFVLPTRLLARQDFAFKPVMAFCLVFCLVFGGGFLTVLAAKNSLPGELLYPVKIAVENTKVRVSSQETKPRLQAEFVGTRVEEISQIIEETEDPIEKKEKVVKTVNKLQAQVASTKAQLDKVKEAQPEKVAEVAEAINEKSIESEKALIEVKEKLAQEPEQEGVIEAIDDALSIISAANKERETLIQMEVKEIKELPVEIFNDFNEASESFENIIGD